MAGKNRPFTTHELEAFLDEALAPEEMARVEMALRSQPKLARTLAEISGRRDAGVHSLGEIWRRNRASCPTRDQLGSFILGAMDNDEAEYIDFHIQTIGCRYCQANLQDLKRRQEESVETSTQRRSKYFQSSAGYLRPDR